MLLVAGAPAVRRGSSSVNDARAGGPAPRGGRHAEAERPLGARPAPRPPPRTRRRAEETPIEPGRRTTVTWFQFGGHDFKVGHHGRRPVGDDARSPSRLISLLVHVYSTEYLHGRPPLHPLLRLPVACSPRRCSSTSSPQNTLQMLIGWELVGVCSFVLIGHWWEEKPNTDAALKAFLTNRVGDVGLIIGVIILFFAAGHSFNVARHQRATPLDRRRRTTRSLLVGAPLPVRRRSRSKSGQFPLHTWLPDAMAGPTPVSALIHAATMVVAGVYLIARLYSVFFEGLYIGTGQHQLRGLHRRRSPPSSAPRWPSSRTTSRRCWPTPPSASSATWSWPSASAPGPAAVFHLFTHAFFKACLFLGAGSVSHAAHHTFDMRKMGGLRKYMPQHLRDLHHRHRSPSPASSRSPASGRRTRSWPGRCRARRQRLPADARLRLHDGAS